MGWFYAVLVYILMCKCSLSVATSIALQKMCVLLGFLCFDLLYLFVNGNVNVSDDILHWLCCIISSLLQHYYSNNCVFFCRLFCEVVLCSKNAIFIIKCTFKIYLLLHCSVIIMSISI